MKTYEEFKEALKTSMKEKLGETAEVIVNLVTKTNRTEEQITVRLPGARISPSFSLFNLYTQYRKTQDLDEMADGLINYLNQIPEDIRIPMLTFEDARENIFYQLISKEKNEVLLKECLYREMPNTDLVMVLRWRCGADASFIVKHGVAERLELPEEELFKMADDNLANEKIMLRNLNEVIAEMMECGNEDAFPNPEPNLIILTNERMRYGAAMIFKSGVAEGIHQMLGSPYFIIPSSVHEVLIIPDTGEVNPEELLTMVKEVNRTEVAEEDILSAHVYRYDSTTGVATVV